MKTDTRAGSLRIRLDIGIWFLFLNIVQPEQWAESKSSQASCDHFESSECIRPIETFSSVDKRLRVGKSHCRSAITEGSHEVHAGCWQKKQKPQVGVGWVRVLCQDHYRFDRSSQMDGRLAHQTNISAHQASRDTGVCQALTQKTLLKTKLLKTKRKGYGNEVIRVMSKLMVARLMIT